MRASSRYRSAIGRGALACCCAAILTGCATQLWWGNRSTTLTMGMSQKQAHDMLGDPQSIMQQELNGVMVETWKYLDRTLVFHNGMLQSWRGAPQQDGATTP